MGMVLFCLVWQTDSEQTDFAFDGETTATEVCTPSNSQDCSGMAAT